MLELNIGQAIALQLKSIIYDEEKICFCFEYVKSGKSDIGKKCAHPMITNSSAENASFHF